MSEFPADYFNYRVEWSHPHEKHVGLVAEFPMLMFLHEDPVAAREGIRGLVAQRLGIGFVKLPDGGCSCGYAAGSRPTQIGCGARVCPFRRVEGDGGGA